MGSALHEGSQALSVQKHTDHLQLHSSDHKLLLIFRGEQQHIPHFTFSLASFAHSPLPRFSMRRPPSKKNILRIWGSKPVKLEIMKHLKFLLMCLSLVHILGNEWRMVEALQLALSAGHHNYRLARNESKLPFFFFSYFSCCSLLHLLTWPSQYSFSFSDLLLLFRLFAPAQLCNS